MNNTRSKVIVAGHACIDITPVFPDKQMKKDTKEEIGSAHAANLLSKVLIPGKLVQMKGVDINPGGAVSNTGLAMKLYDLKHMWDRPIFRKKHVRAITEAKDSAYRGKHILASHTVGEQ